MTARIAIPMVFLPMLFGGFSGASAVELLGAGATFPYPLYSKMFSTYWKETGVKVNYQAIGSGGGQRQLVNMTVDFGGSDAFMSDEALAAAPAKILHLPICLGAVVLTYNLPGNPQLKLTSEVIADLFMGKISHWNDERIKALNPDVALPETKIMVVHRADGSGTTFVFTDYVSKVSPGWEKKLGRGTAINWPTGLGAKGNPGVVGLIKQLPGAIGYTELGYASLNHLPVALLKNRQGKFVTPSVETTTLAAVGSLPEDTRASLTDTDAPDGYPISSFTWILVYQEQAYGKRPREKAAALAKLFWWMIHEGQQYTEPLHYSPLSAEAVKKAENIIASMRYDGRPVHP